MVHWAGHRPKETETMILYSGGGETFLLPELPTKVRNAPAKKVSVPRPNRSEEAHTVYRAYAADGSLVYVGITSNLDQRVTNHENTTWWWRTEVHKLTMSVFPDKAAAEIEESQAIFHERPTRNLQRWVRH